MKNLLSIEALTREEILDVIALGGEMKANRGRLARHPLRHRCWGMIFTKSSTRTRVSFEVGIRELGGDALFLNANDLQLGRGEPIEDTARVLGRMLHGAVIRTFAQSDVEVFAQVSGLPTINALTDAEHPCQILSDLFTIQEQLGDWRGKKVCYLGDGACNVPASWLWAAARLGDFELVIAAPEKYQPTPELLARLGPAANVRCEEDPACGGGGGGRALHRCLGEHGHGGRRRHAHDGPRRLRDRRPIWWHGPSPGRWSCTVCRPIAGRKSPPRCLEAHADTIFTQAENRLHVQKAILSLLADAHETTV